jgi:hypothetical protein
MRISTRSTTQRWRLGSRREFFASALVVAGLAILHVGGVGCAWGSNVSSPPYVLQPYTGTNQIAKGGTAVPIPPSVQLTNATGNPISGITIVFHSLTAGAVLADSTGVTTSNGVVTIGSWRLGQNAGVYVLQASISGAGLPDISTTFRATATP